MNCINQKINEIAINKFSDNNVEFAKFMCTNEANIRNYRKNTEPKLEFIRNLADKLEISYDYFFDEKIGLMTEDEIREQKIKNIQKLPENRNIGIPLIPVEAMAGYGNGDVQVMDYDIQENYLITPELENKGIKYLIRTSGSSMTPKYNNGDLLACRPVTDISFIQWGKVYVLDTDQGPLVKRLYQCNPSDDDCLECRSDNFEKYPPFKISKMSIRRIAIVVAVLRLE